MLRNLIALTTAVFREPSILHQMPIAPASTPALLHLSMTPQGGTGNADSPASSVTSEQPSMADVHEERPSGGDPKGMRSASKGVRTVLSFGRSKKPK